MRRICLVCCARAASGHVAAVPPRRTMKSRRRIAALTVRTRQCSFLNSTVGRCRGPVGIKYLAGRGLPKWVKPGPDGPETGLPGYPRKADFLSVRRHVSKVPTTEVAALFDHL